MIDFSYRKYIILKIGVDKMKTKILSALMISTLLLAACQDNTETEMNNNNNDHSDTSEVQADEQTETTENLEDENEEEEENEEIAYQYKINPDTHAIIPIDPESDTEEKVVLLTFDDAPDGYTLQIADALEERGVSAIFFVNGMYMENEEGFEVIKDLHERGFEIGNHTHTHMTLPDYPEEEQRGEIEKTNDIVEEATGETPRFFRAPHGMMTDYTRDLIPEIGMAWMNWSFGYDWESEYRDPAALTEITLTTFLLSNGANILMHDREWTAEAVPGIVDGLIEQGYTIVDPKLISHED